TKKLFALVRHWMRVTCSKISPSSTSQHCLGDNPTSYGPNIYFNTKKKVQKPIPDLDVYNVMLCHYIMISDNNTSSIHYLFLFKNCHLHDVLYIATVSGAIITDLRCIN